MRMMHSAVVRWFGAAAAAGVALACAGCARATSGEWVRASAVSVYGAYNTGGVIENYEAVSGATQPMYSAAAGVEFEVKGYPVEVGLGWHAFDQTISPYELVYQYRDIRFSQLRVPMTYNWDLVRSGRRPVLALKLGVSAGYTALLSITDRGNASPPYTFNRLDFSPVLGVAVYPFRFPGNALGLFADVARGTVIYDDGWSTVGGFGNIGILRAGLTFRALER